MLVWRTSCDEGPHECKNTNPLEITFHVRAVLIHWGDIIGGVGGGRRWQVAAVRFGLTRTASQM